MKKICKLMTLILAMALLIFTPGISAVSTCLMQLTPAAAATPKYTAPTQSSTLFNSSASLSDLSTWSKPSTDNNLVTEQVTIETNAKFHEKHPSNSLADNMILSRSPFVILNDTLNVPVKGGYSASDINLLADSHYLISVDYYVLEQKEKDSNVENIAFGTFYLNKQTINLLPQNKGWDTATFYIKTDKLTSATVTPELYFGSLSEKALGAIYFDNFNVTAVSQSIFETELANSNSSNSRYIDFTCKNDIVKIAEFENTDFTATITATNADSNNNIPTQMVPSNLGFEDEQSYFYHKDGENKNVMLMKATNSNTGLNLNNYTFEPKPYEVYMFQFYSIATAAENFKSFYFMIGNTAQEIQSIADYPHHNGWQLNTIFFIANQKLNQEYKLGFTLGNNEAASGWVCIDEFKIFKVNGSYAQKNAESTGVHDINDQNSSDTTLDIANGNFDLGRSSDTVSIAGSSYPYPLVAESWTTNHSGNGIVNTHATLWHDRFGNENPGQINNNYSANNHVYMMYNATADKNILTSPALTITTGSITYISFDAYSDNTTQTHAYILTAETDEEGNLTNEIILPNTLAINDGEWHHYEFAINQNEFATSRQFYLRIEMNNTGYTYIDNVRTSQTTTGNQTTNAIVDLNNAFNIDKSWKATDEFAIYNCNATPTGVTLEIFNQPKTVLENIFGYNLTAEEYFEIIIEARGNNAFLGLSNYDGLLEVITDEVNPNEIFTYKLYLQPKADATAVNLQITLGSVNTEENLIIANGNIFIKSLKINKINEDEFDLACTAADADSRMKVLAVSEKEEENDDDTTQSDNNFFGENWWYLIPSLITAIAVLLGIIAFLLRKIKFDRHITKKTTSYARDMRLKNQQKKIVAQKAAKVDNVVDEKQSS